MCDKVKLPNKKIAFKVARKMKDNAKILPRQELRAYYCFTCKAYHLTKMTEQEYRNKLKENESKRFKKVA
jgi:hypothetical protein